MYWLMREKEKKKISDSARMSASSQGIRIELGYGLGSRVRARG
jgi:hypothetical protein